MENVKKLGIELMEDLNLNDDEDECKELDN